MPIHPLSDATSRALTSTQTLNNAVSVVKELIENALDARASSIAIEISANTLDKIIVRDDGLGIGVQDRRLLCKRGCTSKITNLDDLAQLGGSFLGFRGTALASIAELSKDVTIVTRVDGEQPATTMTFGPSGKLLSSASASHNTGTTVRVENFLVSVPVRSQVVLKNPSKTLDEIRRLLQRYALARPSVKLSLKVLKAKTDKANWSFAACRESEPLVSAATQVVGKSVVSSCKSYTRWPDENDNAAGYRIDALVLDAQTHDISKASGLGQFVSIDGRPVSEDRGVMKDLAKKYKLYLKSCRKSGPPVPSKPFLAIHLHCPLSSYDVNIEPSKDEVLFHDRASVINLFEKLFIEYYGPVEQNEENVQLASNQEPPANEGSSFDLLLARKRPAAERSQDGRARDTGNDTTRIISSLRGNDTQTNGFLLDTFTGSMTRPLCQQSRPPSSPLVRDQQETVTTLVPHLNMYTGQDEHEGEDPTEATQRPHPDDEDELYDPQNHNINNPFTRAKFYSLRRSEPSASIQIESTDPVDSNCPNSIPSNIDSDETAATPVGRIRMGPRHRLPTPATSPDKRSSSPYQNPGPPFLRRSKQVYEDEEEASSGERGLGREQRLSPPKQQLLDQLTTSRASACGSSFESATTARPRSSGHHSSQASKSLTAETGRVEGHRVGVNAPVRSPLRMPPLPTNDPTNNQHNLSQDLQSQPPTLLASTPSSAIDVDNELQDILEFERQKRQVNQIRKTNQATSHLRTSRDSPGTNNSSSVFHLRPTSMGSVIPPPPPFRFDQPAVRSTNNLDTSSPRKSNPHQNRYLAALRTLNFQDNNNFELENESKNVGAEEKRQVIPQTDPRGYLITLPQNSSREDRLTGSSLKIKRVRTSRLPFETITPNILKHNVLAIMDDPVPLPIDDLRRVCNALAEHDEYVRTGKIEPVVLSLDGSISDEWQERIQELVKEKFRAIPTAARHNPGREGGRDSLKEDNDRNDSGRGDGTNNASS